MAVKPVFKSHPHPHTAHVAFSIKLSFMIISNTVDSLAPRPSSFDLFLK